MYPGFKAYKLTECFVLSDKISDRLMSELLVSFTRICGTKEMKLSTYHR